MTLRQKGPVDNTPARLGPSTGERCDNICDECLEHLGRIADEAQNFGIPSFARVYDYRSSPEWQTCCKRVKELVLEAADTIRNYGERVRDMLRDKIAMEKLLANDWPAFEPELRRLFLAIREIYNSAGISPTLPIQRMGGQILYGSDGLEHDIQARMKRHDSEIRGARKAPLEEFYTWRAKERQARANSESEAKVPAHQLRPGPKPDPERHRAIAETVKPFGDNWNDPAKLKEITKKLDEGHVTPPKRREKNRNERPIRSWKQAYKDSPERVIKAILRSLKAVMSNSGELRETKEN